nr:MAG TPA: Protein of unknown function (DUF3945) [Caudoviricetes sp.]
MAETNFIILYRKNRIQIPENITESRFSFTQN